MIQTPTAVTLKVWETRRFLWMKNIPISLLMPSVSLFFTCYLGRCLIVLKIWIRNNKFLKLGDILWETLCILQPQLRLFCLQLPSRRFYYSINSKTHTSIPISTWFLSFLQSFSQRIWSASTFILLGNSIANPNPIRMIRTISANLISIFNT